MLKASEQVKRVRGMPDLLPEDLMYWQKIEAALRRLMACYHYEEVRFPLLESTALFQRSVGEQTDIVSKEMYTFEDRNGESVSLRPEGTAGCVRLCLQNGLLHNQAKKVWYLGPMFRHERPQKGRQRQFHQFGMEAFGFSGPDIAVELLLCCQRLWRQLGVAGGLQLEINTLGSVTTQQNYAEALRLYWQSHDVCMAAPEIKQRVEKNPVRVLDSKAPFMRPLIAAAPSPLDYLEPEDQCHFDGFCALLDQVGVAYRVNPHLVRGLDYYNATVFEWTTTALGAQNTVCAGGRFDRLTQQLGGKPVPAVGLAMGLERLIAVYQHCKAASPHSLHADKPPLVYIVQSLPDVSDRDLGSGRSTVSLRIMGYAMQVAEQIRDAGEQLRVFVHTDTAVRQRSQMKQAYKWGAKWVVIVDAASCQTGTVTLRQSPTQIWPGLTVSAALHRMLPSKND